MSPSTRLKGAWFLFVLSWFGGLYSVVWLARDPYEKVLMAISWGAITITCLDIILTADVRKKQK